MKGKAIWIVRKLHNKVNHFTKYEGRSESFPHGLITLFSGMEGVRTRYSCVKALKLAFTMILNTIQIHFYFLFELQRILSGLICTTELISCVNYFQCLASKPCIVVNTK